MTPSSHPRSGHPPTRALRSPAIVLWALLTLAGCAGFEDPLAGSSWRLIGWSVSSVDPASTGITAAFADGRISGYAGVNRYSGDYTSSARDRFRAERITATRRASTDKTATRAESAYLALLDDVRSLKVDGQRLVLYDANGNETLAFERTASSP